MSTQFQEQKVTIDDLAIMVQKGFTDMRRDMTNSYNSLDARFTQRCDELDAHFTQKFDELDTRFTKRFDELDVRIDSIAEQYTPKSEHALLKARTMRIERKIGL